MRVKDIGGTLRRVARAGVALLTGLAVLAAGAVGAQARPDVIPIKQY